MLETPGDLIPVIPAASGIPWSRRRSQILSYLQRGPVKFTTLVYDTNVGDITPISSYFNPERISVKELNSKFGQYPNNHGTHPIGEKRIGHKSIVKPRLLLYPQHPPNFVGPVKRPAARKPKCESFDDLNRGEKEKRQFNWGVRKDSTLSVDELLRSDIPPLSPKRFLSSTSEDSVFEDPCIIDLDCINLGQQLSDSWRDPQQDSLLSQTMPAALGLTGLMDGVLGETKWSTNTSDLFSQTTWL